MRKARPLAENEDILKALRHFPAGATVREISEQLGGAKVGTQDLETMVFDGLVARTTISKPPFTGYVISDAGRAAAGDGPAKKPGPDLPAATAPSAPAENALAAATVPEHLIPLYSAFADGRGKDWADKKALAEEFGLKGPHATAAHQRIWEKSGCPDPSAPIAPSPVAPAAEVFDSGAQAPQIEQELAKVPQDPQASAFEAGQAADKIEHVATTQASEQPAAVDHEWVPLLRPVGAPNEGDIIGVKLPRLTPIQKAALHRILTMLAYEDDNELTTGHILAALGAPDAGGFTLAEVSELLSAARNAGLIELTMGDWSITAVGRALLPESPKVPNEVKPEGATPTPQHTAAPPAADQAEYTLWKVEPKQSPRKVGNGRYQSVMDTRRLLIPFAQKDTVFYITRPGPNGKPERLTELDYEVRGTELTADQVPAAPATPPAPTAPAAPASEPADMRSQPGVPEVGKVYEGIVDYVTRSYVLVKIVELTDMKGRGPIGKVIYNEISDRANVDASGPVLAPGDLVNVKVLSVNKDPHRDHLHIALSIKQAPPHPEGFGAKKEEEVVRPTDQPATVAQPPKSAALPPIVPAAAPKPQPAPAAAAVATSLCDRCAKRDICPLLEHYQDPAELPDEYRPGRLARVKIVFGPRPVVECSAYLEASKAG